MKNKKILHIVEAWGGGIFSFLVDLVNNTSKDYDIVIAHGMRDETFGNFKDYFDKDIKFIEVKNFRRSLNPVTDVKAFLEVKKIIKEENPDIVHLHSSKAGFIGRFACDCKKTKVLYNPHGFSFLMQDVSKIKRYIYLFAEKLAALKKCTIVGCSQGEYEIALKLRKDAVCISNGVNIDKLLKETNTLEEKKIDFNNLKVCTIGRIDNQKNPIMFNSIAENFPDTKFTWIGEGKEKEKLVSSNIKVTGWKNRDEVLKILNENDIFILTSLWEGLPISLLEAMYLKKICIVNDCVGNRDVIKDNKNGFVCKNVPAFVNTIKELKNTDCNSLKLNAFNDIENTYNLAKLSEGYKDLYNNSESSNQSRFAKLHREFKL